MGWETFLASAAGSSGGQNSGLTEITPINVNSVGVNLGEFLGNNQAPVSNKSPVTPGSPGTGFALSKTAIYAIVGGIVIYLITKRKRR